MTDQELLERAARATGNEAVWSANDPFKLGSMLLPNGQYWNPLDDDGDALRLMVDLGLTIQVDDDEERIRVLNEVKRTVLVNTYSIGKHATARRAIVRAAAMRGKGDS
jgi:hypothetical protein